MSAPLLDLRSGTRIPQLGLGVFKVDDDEAEGVVERALAEGYRHVDTAEAYGNEAGVGRGLRASAVGREEVFVTTKVWNHHQGAEEPRQALEASLERLGLDHVDLYLIHWPAPAQDRFVETWHALLALRGEGLARAVGVSNFEIEHLERLAEEAGEMPDINQVELHPWLTQAPLRHFHAEHGILTEAWSPLARGELLDDATLREVGERHGRTPAQVVLRWHVQLGNVVIPKSVTPARIAENLNVFGFELDEREMQAIGALDRGHRTGPDPRRFS